MSLKLHYHGNGITGLAAFCDTCGEMITKDTAPGYVVWKCDKTGNVTEWRLIHQGVCDPGLEDGTKAWPMSMPFDAELIYLANCSGIDLEQAIQSVLVFDSIS